MKKIHVYKGFTVPINYDAPGNSRFIKRLRPVVFKEGDNFCCLLGPDKQNGILGKGATPDIAIKDWETHIFHRLENVEEDDAIISMARKQLISNDFFPVQKLRSK